VDEARFVGRQALEDREQDEAGLLIFWYRLIAAASPRSRAA
jgi:hypothetical protein